MFVRISLIVKCRDLSPSYASHLLHLFTILDLDILLLLDVIVTSKFIVVRFFRFKERSIMHLLDKVKLISFWWPKAKYVNFSFGYHMEWVNLLTCLGICWCRRWCDRMREMEKIRCRMSVWELWMCEYKGCMQK